MTPFEGHRALVLLLVLLSSFSAEHVSGSSFNITNTDRNSLSGFTVIPCWQIAQGSPTQLLVSDSGANIALQGCTKLTNAMISVVVDADAWGPDSGVPVIFVLQDCVLTGSSVRVEVTSDGLDDSIGCVATNATAAGTSRGIILRFENTIVEGHGYVGAIDLSNCEFYSAATETGNGATNLFVSVVNSTLNATDSVTTTDSPIAAAAAVVFKARGVEMVQIYSYRSILASASAASNTMVVVGGVGSIQRSLLQMKDVQLSLDHSTAWLSLAANGGGSCGAVAAAVYGPTGAVNVIIDNLTMAVAFSRVTVDCAATSAVGIAAVSAVSGNGAQTMTVSGVSASISNSTVIVLPAAANAPGTSRAIAGVAVSVTQASTATVTNVTLVVNSHSVCRVDSPNHAYTAAAIAGVAVAAQTNALLFVEHCNVWVTNSSLVLLSLGGTPAVAAVGVAATGLSRTALWVFSSTFVAQGQAYVQAIGFAQANSVAVGVSSWNFGNCCNGTAEVKSSSFQLLSSSTAVAGSGYQGSAASVGIVQRNDYGTSGSLLIHDTLVVAAWNSKSVVQYSNSSGDLSWMAGASVGSQSQCWTGSTTSTLRNVTYLLTSHSQAIVDYPTTSTDAGGVAMVGHLAVGMNTGSVFMDADGIVASASGNSLINAKVTATTLSVAVLTAQATPQSSSTARTAFTSVSSAATGYGLVQGLCNSTVLIAGTTSAYSSASLLWVTLPAASTSNAPFLVAAFDSIIKADFVECWGVPAPGSLLSSVKTNTSRCRAPSNPSTPANTNAASAKKIACKLPALNYPDPTAVEHRTATLTRRRPTRTATHVHRNRTITRVIHASTRPATSTPSNGTGPPNTTVTSAGQMAGPTTLVPPPTAAPLSTAAPLPTPVPPTKKPRTLTTPLSRTAAQTVSMTLIVYRAQRLPPAPTIIVTAATSANAAASAVGSALAAALLPAAASRPARLAAVSALPQCRASAQVNRPDRIGYPIQADFLNTDAATDVVITVALNGVLCALFTSLVFLVPKVVQGTPKVRTPLMINHTQPAQAPLTPPRAVARGGVRAVGIPQAADYTEAIHLASEAGVVYQVPGWLRPKPSPP